jgi:hypothetical protein
MVASRLHASPEVAWLLLAGLLALGCRSGKTHEGDAPRATASSDAERPAPATSRPGEGTLRRIEGREQVRLTGPRVDAREGDWLLENDGEVAVVDAHGGRLVDFGTAGHDDALVAVEPTLYLGLDGVETETVSLEPAPGAPSVLRIERRLRPPRLRLWTFVSFAGPTVRLESVATSAGEASQAVTIGEIVGWGNVPTWVQGTGFVTSGGTFAGDFLAREGLGQAYALGREGGRIGARFNAPGAGFHERPHTGEDTVTVPADGESPRRAVRIAHASGALGDAVVVLLRAEGVALDPVTLKGVAAARAVAEVTACGGPRAPAGAPFARFALGPEGRDVMIPHGCHRVRVTAPGCEATPFVPVADLDRVGAALEPRAGRLRWHVTEPGGGTIPARLVVRGLAPTPDPDWGDEPFEGAALEVVHTLGDGEVPIPPGRYRVVASRGIEYTAHEQTIVVQAGHTATIDAVLEHVVDTRGWISADLHVHAVPSPDAPTLLEDRVRSLAAAGVEVAVATDHNAVTDYAPTIHMLGAQRWLASVVGDEVTTRNVELGHFNVFPLAAGAAPIPFESTTPRDIFAAARASGPEGRDKVVQVNHPRMGRIGYFELIHLDPGDVDAWRRHAALFDASFDAIEVFNGDDYADVSRVETCLRDWYALLDAGVRATATGNSDSHKLTYHEAGVPRNFVRVESDTPAAFDERSFVEAVRRGRVVVSSGPFIRLSAAGAEVGDDIEPGTASVHVRVEAPPWVDVRTVDLVRRGEIVQSWKVDATSATMRLDATTSVELRSGDWLVALARGERPMTMLHRWGARPFAFTNPIRAR